MAEMTFETFLAETREAEKRKEAKEKVAIQTETKKFNELSEKLAEFDKIEEPLTEQQKDNKEFIQSQIDSIKEDRLYRENEDKYKSEEKISFEKREAALDAMKTAIEAQGKLAENNEEYIKQKQKLERDVFQAQLKDASPARKKEMLKEEAARNKKNLTVLQRISVGIRGLGEKFMEGAGKALDSSFLKGAALIALLFLLPKILNSETFKKGVKFIETTVIPAIKNFVQFLEDSFGEKGPIIAGLLGITALLAPTLMFKGFGIALKGLKLAFVAVKFFINNKLTRALLELLKDTKVGRAVTGAIKGLKGAFIAVKTKLALTFTNIAASLAPLLVPAGILIAIVAGVAALLYSFVDAFVQFQETLKETGSVGEAIKAALSRFISTLLAIIPGLFLKLVGFVAKLFGFEEFAKKLPSIGELSDMMFGGIMRFFSFIADLVGQLVDFLADNAIIRGVMKLFGKSDEELEERSERIKENRRNIRQKRKENLEKQQAKIQEKRELEEERGGKGRFLTLEENRQAQLNEMEQKKTMETTTTAPVIINNDSSVRSNSSNTQSVNETITSRDGMLVSAVSDF